MLEDECRVLLQALSVINGRLVVSNNAKLTSMQAAFKVSDRHGHFMACV